MIGARLHGGQADSAVSTDKADKASAYYHYMLARLYSEMATTQDHHLRSEPNREYAAEAIENYKQAIKADPGAPLLTQELSDAERGHVQVRPLVPRMIPPSVKSK